VGLIWAATTRLSGITVRYERYVRGLRALGHDPLTVCLPAAAAGYPEPVALAPTEAALRDPEFYRPRRFEAALVMTWLGLPEIVAAVKESCPWVVSIADSDGQIGVRTHPGATFRRTVYQHSRFGMKLRAAKYWLQLYALGPAEQDQPVLASAGPADRIAVCSSAAAAHLRRFFDSYRRPDLAGKVMAAPYPIDECYRTPEVPVRRGNQVVAIGRWDDPQKDAGLLCRAADRFLSTGGRAEFLLVGPNGGRAFEALTRRWSQVRYLGPCPPDVVAEHLRNSRVLLLPSRWESGPIVLNEALASGCTVVGTDAIPSVVSACVEGGFGAASRGRSAAGLAQALRSEMSAWERGERNPVAIAAYWRPRFDPVTVCRELLAGHPPEATPRIADE
jgi:glycosyltransferase involved in cell wall biosynthesis